MHDYVSLLKEAVDKLKHYGPQPVITLSRPFAGEKDPVVLEALLQEAVQKVETHAKRQGKRRMAGKSFGDGTVANPNAGSHYPWVQSFLDRARAALKVPLAPSAS